MRIGLLLCDHVPPELDSIAGDYDAMFRRLFACHEEVEIVAYDAINGEMPTDPSECDAWMTTGSRHSVNDDASWIRSLEEFVRAVDASGVPFVGICFGHQLLAKALGGEVAKSEGGWGVGIKHVEVSAGLSFAPSARESFRVFNIHSEQVARLPDRGESIAWNDHCPVSMMMVGPSNLGIQGHPEMGVDYGGALLRTRRGAVIPEQTADEGLDSLDGGSDSAAIADLIVNFITDQAV